MAIKAKVLERARVPGAERVTFTEVTFDSEYAKEGEPCTAKELGLRRIIGRPRVSIINATEAEALPILCVYYDTKESKLRAINAKNQKEIEEKKDLSKVVVVVEARGY